MGWVLCHINHWRIFKPNPVYTYISNIYMICKHILLITFLNKSELFLHTVKRFQVLLYNSHYLTWVICLHTISFIWSIDRTLSGTTTPGQNGPGSNGNEGILCIHQVSKTGASPSDGLISYLGYSSEAGGVLTLCRDTVGVFYRLSQPTGQSFLSSDHRIVSTKIRLMQCRK